MWLNIYFEDFWVRLDKRQKSIHDEFIDAIVIIPCLFIHYAVVSEP